MKKLYLVLCMALCMVTFSACGGSKNDTSSSSYDKDTLISTYEETVEGISGQDYSSLEDADTYDNFVDSYGEDVAQSLLSFEQTTSEFGDYVSCGEESISYSDGDAVVESKVKYNDGTIILRMTFDTDYNALSFSTEEYKTLGEKMIDGLLNTIMGMGTVFVVLIFISIIIWMLKFVPRLFEKKQPEAKVVTSIQTVEQEEPEEELVTDDTELVAVITAAIYASLGDEVPADGLVVRSIRKVNNKWKNA